MNPLQVLREHGITPRRVSQTARGWKLSAPHREDRNPSFSIYKVDPSLPDDDPHAWAVKDFAEGISMGFRRYLREFFGIDPWAGERRWRSEPEFASPVKRSDLFAEVAVWLKQPELEPVEPEAYERVLAANIPYRGHGFAELELDSREFGVYLDPEDHKPVIIYRDNEGRVVGVKKRIGSPKMKYVWTAGKGWLFHIRRGSKSAIVVEGEFKAIAFAHLYQDVDVIGVPSISMLYRAPILGYDNVLFVLDPDAAEKLLVRGQLERLEKLMLAATYLGIGVKVLNFEKHFGERDINDYITSIGSTVSTEHIRKTIKEHARRMRFRDDLVKRYLPEVRGDLSTSAVQLLYAMLVLALSRGKWLNRCATRFDAPPALLAKLTGMGVNTIYVARRELERAGLISIEQGKLASNGGNAPNITLNFCKVKNITNTPKHSFGFYFSSNDITEGDTPTNAITFDISALFHRQKSARYPYRQVRISWLLDYTMNRASRRIREKISRLLTTMRALELEFKRVLRDRIRRYRAARNLIIYKLRRAMPGTYVMGGRVHNPSWPFDLPLSYLLNGELEHG